MKSSIISAGVLATFAAAAPLSRRAADDATILNYALTLEHLEAAFYAEGINKFSAEDFTQAGFDGANFYKNLKAVAEDELTHVDFLTTALKAAGATPVAACTYDFGNLTATSFLQTASVLEGVGVSAYLGAAALIVNKDYLTAAASILTVEARHSAFIRGSLSMSPVPQPFDTPLDFDQVYSLAAPFISECPASNPTLPVKAFPALTLAPGTESPVPQGVWVDFVVAEGTTLPEGPLFVAFPLVTGPVFSAVVVKDGKVSVRTPVGFAGPSGESFAILTTNDTMVNDDNTIAGPAVIEIQPLYLAQ